MVDRLLARRITGSKKSILLLGPRQVGKSTLCRSLSPLRTIDLADEGEFLRYSKDPSRLRRELRALPRAGLVVVDEIGDRPAVKRGMAVGSDLSIDVSSPSPDEKERVRKLLYNQRGSTGTGLRARAGIFERHDEVRELWASEPERSAGHPRSADSSTRAEFCEKLRRTLDFDPPPRSQAQQVPIAGYDYGGVAGGSGLGDAVI